MAEFYEDIAFYPDTSEYKDTIQDMIGWGLVEESMVNSLGRLKINTGAARISQCMRQVLSTPIGSRFFNDLYGSKLHTLVFEPNDFIVKDLASVYVKEALKTWIKRAIVVDVLVDTDTDPQKTYIKIIYRIIGVDSLESLEFAFRREVRSV